MPDENSAADKGGEGAGAAADEKNAADQGQGDNDAQDQGTGDEGGEAGDDAGAGDGKGDDKGKDADDFKDDGNEPVVRQRKTAKDYIIERKTKKVEKLQKGDKQQGAKDEDEGGDEDAAGDDDEIAPEDEALVSKVVDKKLEPLLKERREAEDKADVEAFVAANPDFAKYKAKVLRYIQHPSRANLPVESVFYEVAGPDLMKIGAKRAQAADDEAKKGRTGGGGSRSVGGSKPVSEMTDAEFQAMQETVRQKGR